MSLTSHLKNSKSLVSKFFKDHFGNIQPLREEWNTLIAKAPTNILPTKPQLPFSTIGTALDYRLRYYFDITPPYKLIASEGMDILCNKSEILVWSLKKSRIDIKYEGKGGQAAKLSFNFIKKLNSLLDELQPPGQRLSRPNEEQLCRYCYVLALYEEIYRAGFTYNSPLFTLTPKQTYRSLLALADPLSIDDLCRLSWAFYDKFYKSFARSIKEKSSLLNPTFAGSTDIGGADADIIIDGCLIDFKTTINPGFKQERIYQLLGYLLLDYNNQYRINEVGIYLTRQSLLIRWPVKSLLEVLTGSTRFSLPRLRQSFRTAILENI